MIGKLALQQDKPLARWWNGVVTDAKFQSVTVFALAELCESGMNQEQLKGATNALALFRTLAEGEESAPAIPSPGLNHELEPTQPTEQPQS